MELVEGPTLAERLRQGPLPLDEALAISRQIAEAVEAAHEKGIVHRDLKPANVKINAEGVVKVLDFGLAKAAEEPVGTDNPSDLPTQTISATRAGVILGTAAYMSPEQARGAVVDKRSDIWAFGCVLYEMLSGKQAFHGETTSDILAAVLKEEPDWSRIPARVQPLLRRCLVTDPKRRLRDIGDAMPLLEGIPEVAVVRPRMRPWTAAPAFAFALCIVGVGWWRATRPIEHPLTRWTVDLGPDALTDANITVAISPDGRRLVFPVRGPNGKRQLATRLLEQSQFMLLSGTENGFDPFSLPTGNGWGFSVTASCRRSRSRAAGQCPCVLRPNREAPVGAQTALSLRR